MKFSPFARRVAKSILGQYLISKALMDKHARHINMGWNWSRENCIKPWKRILTTLNITRFMGRLQQKNKLFAGCKNEKENWCTNLCKNIIIRKNLKFMHEFSVGVEWSDDMRSSNILLMPFKLHSVSFIYLLPFANVILLRFYTYFDDTPKICGLT